MIATRSSKTGDEWLLNLYLNLPAFHNFSSRMTEGKKGEFTNTGFL
jgi:hypothetical protein